MSNVLPFGPIIGNLPLLHKHPASLAKRELEGFTEQLTAQCIRRAWLDACKSRVSEKKLLDVYAGLAHIRFAEARGEPVRFHELDAAMEMAKYENEGVMCFGLYVEERADSISHQHGAHGRNPNMPLELDCFEKLEAELLNYRAWVRYSLTGLETVEFVSRLTGRKNYLAGPHPFMMRLHNARATLGRVAA